jgi:alkylhydroperoxidase family enzyme
LAVLQGDDESLAPRARALARLAVILTARPWALTAEAVGDARQQGLDEEQIEAAIGVISLFNYFTRVADATGIEFDYPTALPAFEPDLCQVTAPRPDRPVSFSRPAGGRRRPRLGGLRAAWESWRAYVLEADQPISQRERRLLAAVAAEEAADWEGAEALNGYRSGPDDDHLIGFARKLSRQPWLMGAEDLERLRSLGYSEQAVLHVISVVAHQNADSRLVLGLGATRDKSRSLCRTERGSRPRHPLTAPRVRPPGADRDPVSLPIPVRPGAAVPNRLPTV